MPSLWPHSRASSGSISAEAHAHALRLCREWDVDGDGAISRKELGMALKQIFSDCSEDDVESVMHAVDVNKDGLMQYNEVLEWLRLPPHEKRCFEDALRSYISGSASPQPLVGGMVAAAAGPKLWDERLLQGFVHPLLGRFRVRAESAASASAPSDAVKVRLISRGVRASAGEAVCTVVLRKDAAGGQLIDASIRAADYVGDGVQRLLTTLQHYAEVNLRILEAFCSTIAATEKPTKAACLRFEPPPVVGRDLREIKPVPQAFWSATALALARLSPARQRKLAKAHVDLCVGGNGAVVEYQAVLDAKVQAASSAVGSPSLGEEALPQRKGGYAWVRQDNDPEARLCRLQAFLLTQRAAWAGGYEAAAAAGKPGKPAALTQVERMIQGTSVRLAELAQGNAPPPQPAGARPAELRSLADLGLPERCTVMELARALTAKGKKVAAVNAASAYSVGGGCSSGGRHALEEAWCTTSTLYRSLSAAKAADLVEPEASPFPPQHVPTLGCVVSPAVEIFREGTDQGYRLLPEPVCLCGVVSVAMFNRNPNVNDSPLDCPEDPATYVAHTQAKLESAVLAAADLGADVLVVPDVGCGVFQNDALVVGGCLGSVLRRHPGRLREVVPLAGVHRGFAEACRRAYRGEDPREVCSAGAACGQQFSDPLHAARMLHGSERLDVDAALVVLASNPEEVKKPVCRYGALCHIKKPEHLARFLHPPPSDTIPWSRVVEEAECNPVPAECAPYAPPPDREPVKAEKAELLPRPVAAAAPRSAPAASSVAAPADAAPSQPLARAAAQAAVPAPPALRPSGASAPGAAAGSVGTNVGRPVCRYGEACYNKNPKHLTDFAHPWLEGTDTPEQSKERGDTALVHEMLTLGKAGKWPEVKAILKKRPDLVDGRPDARSFGLVHHAAWQIRMDEMESLVLDFQADLFARTKEGKTAEEVLEESVQLGGLTAAESARAVALQRWLRRTFDIAASPTSAAAAAPPSASPAKAGAAAASASREPELKPRGGVLTVCFCLNMKLEGDYAELAQAHNGSSAYWKATSSAVGGPSGHFIYYNFRTSLGWVIDSDLSDSNEPLAYLGASQCGADPSAKAYGEAWKVHCVSKMAGGYYSRDSVMRIKRR